MFPIDYCSVEMKVFTFIFIRYSRVGAQGLVYAWQVLPPELCSGCLNASCIHRNCKIYCKKQTKKPVIDSLISHTCNHHLRINKSSQATLVPSKFFSLPFETFLVGCPHRVGVGA